MPLVTLACDEEPIDCTPASSRSNAHEVRLPCVHEHLQLPRLHEDYQEVMPPNCTPATRGDATSSTRRTVAASPLPPAFRALTENARRCISQAAGVQSAAKMAIVLPEGLPYPSMNDLIDHGLCHPPDLQGWFTLTDGSVLGLVQADTNRATPAVARMNVSEESIDSVIDGHSHSWIKNSQANALGRVRLKALCFLTQHFQQAQGTDMWNALGQRDYQEAIEYSLPGAKCWPLSDPLANRVMLFNIALGRCKHLTSFLRLDRGTKYLDVTRFYYGEEVAFLFAWYSHYIYMLAAFVLVQFPRICAAPYDFLVAHSVITILFGVAVTELWKARARFLVSHWRAHGDCTNRWHSLVLDYIAHRQRFVRTTSTATLVSHASLISTSTNRPGHNAIAPPALNSPASRTDAAAEARSVGAGSEISFERRVDKIIYEAERCPSSPISLESVVRREVKTSIDALACRSTYRMQTCRTCCRQLAKALLLMCVVLVEWFLILCFFSFIVWFEVWVVFGYGGCSKDLEFGFSESSLDCISASKHRGAAGEVMDALPSICEGALFEVVMAVSKLLASRLMSFYEFRSQERHDFAVAAFTFFLEVAGKIGFITVFGLAFVPDWSSRDSFSCKDSWDYFFQGEYSLSCLKSSIPYGTRLFLFRRSMKGPMIVSTLVGIGLKTLLPLLLETWRWYAVPDVGDERRCAHCCRSRLLIVLLSPVTFVLRVATLIFQADFSAIGGVHILFQWPRTVASEGSGNEQHHGDQEIASPHARTQQTSTVADLKRSVLRDRLRRVLMEGERREYNPFDEYIDYLLHFLWISCFAIVWPFGCAISLVLQIVKYRFDILKLLHVRRRRFPSSRHISVAWVPFFAKIVCWVSIVVNVALLTITYGEVLTGDWVAGVEDSGVRQRERTPVLNDDHWYWVIGRIATFLVSFMVLRGAAVWVLHKALWTADGDLRFPSAVADSGTVVTRSLANVIRFLESALQASKERVANQMGRKSDSHPQPQEVEESLGSPCV